MPLDCLRIFDNACNMRSVFRRDSIELASRFAEELAAVVNNFVNVFASTVWHTSIQTPVAASILR